MESVLKIASYICDRYEKEYGHWMDELKLHKLLYFTQLESLIQFGTPMFDAEFRAWLYGPVIKEIRDAYQEDRLYVLPSEETIEKYKSVFDEVFEDYAGSKSSTLVYLSHGQLAWKRARVGYGEYDKSDIPMKLSDMYEDASRAKQRRKEVEMLRKIQPIVEQYKQEIKDIHML